MSGLAHDIERSAGAVLKELADLVTTQFRDASSAGAFERCVRGVSWELDRLANVGAKHVSEIRPKAVRHWSSHPPAGRARL